jgi:hypothetical protein
VQHQSDKEIVVMKGTGVSAIVGLLLGGCAISPPAEEWRTYERYDELGDGFAIALPPSWNPVALDRDQSVVQAIYASAYTSVQTLYVASKKGALRRAVDSGSAVRFYAVQDPHGPEGRATVSVLKLPLEPEILPLDWYVGTHTEVLGTYPTLVKPVRHRRVSLGTGEVDEFHYQLRLRMPLGDQSVAVTDYFVFGATHIHIVHLTAPARIDDGLRSVIERIGQSLRFLHKTPAA